MIRIIPFFLLIAAILAQQQQQDSARYGVDCSFPIHHSDFPSKACQHTFAEDRVQIYEDYMQGCRDYYGRKGNACDETEHDRLFMSLQQPQSMVNFTSTGFKKNRAPKAVMDLLYAHWEANKDAKEKELWTTGNIYVNHWAAPTYMISVENSRLRGGGFGLKQQIWDAVQNVIQEWTGMEQRPISQYGIRMYTQGAVLSPHVDRLPLVSSCIINVAQDLDEPWPLAVIDRQGNEVNVTMEPGDMVLYESGSLIHARPFPLKGRYMANIFIHFEPTGRPLIDTTNAYLDTLDDFLPPYLQPDTPWTKKWATENQHGWKKPAPSGPKLHSNARESHVAAALGDVDTLQQLAKSRRSLLTKKDENGWMPIHEAARSGHENVIKLLVEKHGADKNARTGHVGEGGSVLNVAREYWPDDASIVQYLLKLDAQDISYGEL
ncbi:hypothetical protein MPSEU_001075700 [Mayamaea pseudoterrestris]|nr:hypothetical protein MPSEU_001075700 [Mayamaea pseudoterrestris]